MTVTLSCKSIRQWSGGPCHHRQPWWKAVRGQAGRGISQGPCLRNTEKVEVPEQNRQVRGLNILDPSDGRSANTGKMRPGQGRKLGTGVISK